jgi:hypothetical protein
VADGGASRASAVSFCKALSGQYRRRACGKLLTNGPATGRRRLDGRAENKKARFLSKPGLWGQRVEGCVYAQSSPGGSRSSWPFMPSTWAQTRGKDVNALARTNASRPWRVWLVIGANAVFTMVLGVSKKSGAAREWLRWKGL